jgi:excisionase family DNA binding protein
VTNKDDAALLSVPSAAKRLGVSEEWVRKAARDRRIRSVKIGSRLLFRPETIDDFIDANTREPVQA